MYNYYDRRTFSPPNKQRGYVKTHWEGEHTLTRSFWINGVLVSYGFNLISLIFGVGLFEDLPRFSSLILACLWLVSPFLYTWQIIGIWRAADGYTVRTKKKYGWGEITKVVAVFWTLRFFSNFFMDAPEIKLLLSIATGNEFID